MIQIELTRRPVGRVPSNPHDQRPDYLWRILEVKYKLFSTIAVLVTAATVFAQSSSSSS